MKRYFFIGLAAILVLAIALVGYGTWLNVSDENQIARRMDERALTLTGAKVKRRSLHPTIEMDAVRLYSENMADAVALIDGRIIEWYVKKNSAVQKGDTLLRLRPRQHQDAFVHAPRNLLLVADVQPCAVGDQRQRQR